jgi:hypothetical protein
MTAEEACDLAVMLTRDLRASRIASESLRAVLFAALAHAHAQHLEVKRLRSVNAALREEVRAQRSPAMARRWVA